MTERLTRATYEQPLFEAQKQRAAFIAGATLASVIMVAALANIPDTGMLGVALAVVAFVKAVIFSILAEQAKKRQEQARKALEKFDNDYKESGKDLTGIIKREHTHATLVENVTVIEEGTLEKLFERGANPNEKDEKGIPLFLHVVANGAAKHVELFLKHGLNKGHPDLQTLPDWVRARNSPEMAQLLGFPSPT